MLVAFCLLPSPFLHRLSPSLLFLLVSLEENKPLVLIGFSLQWSSKIKLLFSVLSRDGSLSPSLPENKREKREREALLFDGVWNRQLSSFSPRPSCFLLSSSIRSRFFAPPISTWLNDGVASVKITPATSLSILLMLVEQDFAPETLCLFSFQFSLLLSRLSTCITLSCRSFHLKCHSPLHQSRLLALRSLLRPDIFIFLAF